MISLTAMVNVYQPHITCILRLYQNYAPDEETDPIFDQVNPYMTLVHAYEKKLRDTE